MRYRGGAQETKILPLIDWYEVSASWLAGVLAQRPVQSVVGELVKNMCVPTGRARERKNRCEQVGRHAERVINGSRVEIDVRVQAPLLFHQCGNPFRHFDPFWFTQFLTQLNRFLTQNWCSRIEDLIDPMADTHDFLLFGQHSFHVSIDLIDRTDLLQHVDHPLVRASVEWSLQSSDSCRQR